jgi:hypothetical protein
MAGFSGLDQGIPPCVMGLAGHGPCGKAWLDVTEAEIIAALLAFIDQGEADEAAFEQMALAVFAYQFAHNQPYRRFAIQRCR